MIDPYLEGSYAYAEDEVSFLGASSPGFFKMVSIEIFNESNQSSTVVQKKSIRIRTNSLPELKHGSNVTLNGESCIVEKILLLDDGLECILVLVG